MGERGMVITADSEYLVKDVTEWVHTWVRRERQTSSNQPVKNQDLWEALFAELRKLKYDGMNVRFRRTPRQWNTVADEAAKRTAMEEEHQKLSRVLGVVV
jgi:ribonuclease HI